MASSYSTSLGIEKMATGDQSGAWGTTTNHNWDIIDRISAYTSVAITTDADTATLTVREASPESGTENLQDGMYRVIKFTGALDSNCTITVAPNTAKVFFIILNATTDSGSSGPYSLILSQGSGANITVGNGKASVIYCDGAGGGAAVIDAFSDLQITDDLSLASDSAVIKMGADDDITVTHVADVGLKLKQAGATGDDKPFILTLQTGELDIAADDVLGQIDFQAPDEATGTDAQLVAAGIAAVSEGDFSSSNNATKLSFKTASSEAATEKMSLSSAGNLDVIGDITGLTLNADGDTSASDNAAIGYTASEGLILTGQGSTNDVTIKNDADTDVLTVPTGTTTVDIVGNLYADGTVAFPEAFNFNSTDGMQINGTHKRMDIQTSSDAVNEVIRMNKMVGDGDLIVFYQAGTEEGYIAVSGTTVSYNTFTGAHEGQWETDISDPPEGTLISTVDGIINRIVETFVNAEGMTDVRTVKSTDPQPEDATRHIAPKPQLTKIKITDEQADSRVYGVFGARRKQGEGITVYAIGTAMVRVKGAISGGDLIQSSATAGVAEKQSDDIIRSSTVGKVSRGDDETGERLVACVLYSG